MESRYAKLESRLAAVERRLSSLEAGRGYSAESGTPSVGLAFNAGFMGNAATHIGRVLLIFGGAYLLRSITDFRLVPTGVGVFLGAGYALLWLFMAWRAAARDENRASAVFYGAAAMSLGLPLMVEATTRFGILSGGQAVVALTVFCALFLGVAVGRNLRSLGWLIIAGGIVSAFVILNAARVAVPVGAFLVALGLASLGAVYWRQWMGPQWLGALGANIGVVVLVLLSTSDQWSVRPSSAFWVGAALFTAYLLAFAVRTHLSRRSVGLFEALQASVAVGIVFWIAGVASRVGELAVDHIGLFSLIFGAGAYALAFTPETRSGRGRNFFFYSTLGLGLVVAGSGLLLSPGYAATAWSALALAMAWFSGRYERVALSLQCTFLLLAAGVISGVLAMGYQALAGGALESWPALAPRHLVVAVTTVACLFIPVAQRSDRWGVLAGLPQLIVLALSVWAVGGVMIVYLAPILAGLGAADSGAATLAALRTAVLSGSAVTLALSSRHRRWPEARWLAYPVLAVVGVKLFFEDFPNGQPVTLFIALGLVGSALILVSRLLGREKEGGIA